MRKTKKPSDKQLAVLAAVERLEPTYTREIARFLNRPHGTIIHYFYTDGMISLVDRGLATLEPGLSRSIRLTDRGRATLQNMEARQ